MIMERPAAFGRKCCAFNNWENEQGMNVRFSVIILAEEVIVSSFSEMPEVFLKRNKLLFRSEPIAPCDEPCLKSR